MLPPSGVTAEMGKKKSLLSSVQNLYSSVVTGAADVFKNKVFKSQGLLGQDSNTPLQCYHAYAAV